MAATSGTRLASALPGELRNGPGPFTTHKKARANGGPHTSPPHTAPQRTDTALPGL